jgi:hypothetical protein
MGPVIHLAGFLLVLAVLWLLGRLRRWHRRRQHRRNETRFGKW